MADSHQLCFKAMLIFCLLFVGCCLCFSGYSRADWIFPVESLSDTKFRNIAECLKLTAKHFKIQESKTQLILMLVLKRASQNSVIWTGGVQQAFYILQCNPEWISLQMAMLVGNFKSIISQL